MMFCNREIGRFDRCRMLKAFLLGKSSRPMKKPQTISIPSQCSALDAALINLKSLPCNTPG